ncbi:MAG: carboxypeptidase regulatory-like domain-containing protein [Bacteroidota bacterium]
MKVRSVTMFVCLVLGLSAAFAQDPTPIPQNLVAQPLPGTINSAKLTWEAPPGQRSYKVYRSVDDTTHFAGIGMTPQKTFTNHGLTPGHTYYYRVTSVFMSNNGVLESAPSNIASFSIAPPVRGVIAGTVTDDSTGLPIRHARISFHRQSGPSNSGPFAFTDSLGQYHALLDTGRYRVRAEAFSNNPATPGYIPEWYNNVTDPALATPVAVAESSLSVANFGLSRPVPPTFAYVSGTVTDTLGNPLRHASVALIRTIQEMRSIEALTGQIPGLGDEIRDIESVGRTHGVVWHGYTDSLGQYRARVISGRSYIAMASKHGYLPEYYDNKTRPTDADVIAVSGDVTGVDFSLAVRVVVQNSVSGRVRDSLNTGVPSRIVLMPVHTPGPNHGHPRFGHTDSTGAYNISHVHAGRYFVLALPFSGYGPAFYKAGAYGVIHWQNADTVNVTGSVSGIDVGVVQVPGAGLARVSGTVRSADGLALGGVSLFAINGGAIVGFTVTDVAGNYTIDAVNTGTIQIVADREGYDPASNDVTVSPTTFTLEDVNLTMLQSAVLSVGGETGTPERFELAQNYPNPFNPSTTISFNLPANSNVTLSVYNLIGQEITTLMNDKMNAGSYDVVWNGKDHSGRSVASGIYFYRLKATSESGNFNEMRKMVLVK